MKEIIVIGGSAAGLKAACRAARLMPDVKVRVLEQSPHFACSTCGLPYFLSGDVDDLAALFSTPAGVRKDEKYFADVKNVEILTPYCARRIDREDHVVHCTNLSDNSEKSFRYDKLVLALGAVPAVLPIPGGDLPGILTFKSPDDALRLRKELEAGRIGSVAIIGAGFIGLELCEAFRSLWGIDVELFESAGQVLPGILDPELASLVQFEILDKGVQLYLNSPVSEIVLDGNRFTITSAGGEKYPAERLINVTGVKPNTALARACGLEIGISGGIVVDGGMRTSDDDIYAAGDCVELTGFDREKCWKSLGSLATRMGRIAADNIAGIHSQFGVVAGAAVLKVFDLTVGSTGKNEASCLRAGIDGGSAWGTFFDGLHYYPDANSNNYKLVYDKKSDRICGMQAVGKGNILHILDKATLFIRSGSLVRELSDIEQAYAPPFSQTIDPLASLAAMIENCRIAGIAVVSPEYLKNVEQDTLLLDVRLEDEAGAFPLPSGAVSMRIPLENLRSRIEEIPQNRQIIAVCQMGGRSYEAALIMRRAGIEKVGFLAGGMLFQSRHIRKT